MILVVGGTGRLGTLVVTARLGRDDDVRVLTRDVARAAHLPEQVDRVVGDLRDPDSLVGVLAGVRTVVAAAHGFVGPRGISPRTVDFEGNVNLLRAAEAVGAEVVLVSIVGAAADHPLELFRMKHAAEEHAHGSGVPTTIVRATAFTELWIELLRETAERSGRPLVFGRGDNPMNFVSVDDVARLVDLAIDDQSTRGASLDIGGPDNISFNELVAVLRTADPTLGPPRHIPPPALAVMGATVGRLKPELRRQARTALFMDRADLVLEGGSGRERFPELPSTPVAAVIDAATMPTR